MSNENETPLSYQVGGDHYRNLKIQPIELFQKTGLDFELANAMKYVIRYKRKNGIEDLQKAKQYLDFYAARWKPLNDFVNAFFRQFDPKTRFLMEEILFGNFESAKMLIDQLEAEYKEADDGKRRGKVVAESRFGNFAIEKIILQDGEVETVKHSLNLERKVPLFCCGLDGEKTTWCCIEKPEACKSRPCVNCEFCSCPNKEAQK